MTATDCRGGDDADEDVTADGDPNREDGSLQRVFGTVIGDWNPIYFAFVMATGIVSIAAWVLGLRLIGWGLFAVNLLAYGIVSTLTLVHIGRDRVAAVQDLVDYDRAVGSFTAIAGTCVLGTQFVIFDVSTMVGTGLLVVGAGLWLLLVYTVFTGLTISDVDEPIDEAIDGSWLLAVVATQSVAVLAGLLAPAYPPVMRVLLLTALSLYSVGGMFYLILITLLFYRMTFFPFDPASATPPYWINTGAVAIATLAGATLIAASGDWVFLARLRPFLVGFTFFNWVAGTWWIPLLAVLGVWRHTIGGIKLPHTADGYDASYWGMVFPLGMYTVSTVRLVDVTAIDVIGVIPEYFVYVALLAWGVVCIGLIQRSRTRLGRV